MALSQQSLDTLIDLVEIKLSCIEVWDRDDERERRALERTRLELLALAGRGEAQEVAGRRPPPPRSRARLVHPVRA